MSEMTVAEVITQWRKDPDKKTLIHYLYYGENVWENAFRFQQSPEFRSVLRIAHHYGKTTGNVLDMGGGNGIATLAWHNEGYQATLLEPDSSDIVGFNALAPVLRERNMTSVSIYEGIAEDTTFMDDEFDIVYCRQVLHHIPDLPKLMREVRRILKPDGVFIATREHVISKKDDLQEFWDNHDLHRYTGGEYAYLESEYIQALYDEFSSVEVIRYYDDVINYYPMSDNEFEMLIKKELCRFSLFRYLHLCSLLSKLLFTRQWAIDQLNEKNDEAGRMYSFVAS